MEIDFRTLVEQKRKEAEIAEQQYKEFMKAKYKN